MATPCGAASHGRANPYSRGATGDDYAKDRRRKKRKRILLGVLAFVLVGVLGATGAAWAYISGIEQEMNEDITPEVVEALEAPAEYDGGTFYMLLMGTDKSAAREQSTQYAGDTFRLRLDDPHARRSSEQEGHHGVDAPRYRD